MNIREYSNTEPEFLGSSFQVNEIKQIIKQVAPTDVTVLITGESGVGKEVVSHLLHLNSKRKSKPFVTVNCAAIPEGIIESELFGHVKGSFTGAVETRKGYFETANSGTIFLDEIGEMPLQTQVKFLRVIENGEFMKVGGSKKEKVDVRIIAATNKNLEQQIANRTFREDLYYRLHSINIFIPPLRERKEDIILLFDYFSKEFARKNSIDYKGLNDEAKEFINNYNWPGNIRQLKNFTESLLTLNSNKMITKEDVLKQLSIKESDMKMPALVYNNKEQEEKMLLFGALFELKKDIMEIKDSIVNMNQEKEYHITPNSFVIPEEKIPGMTFDDFEKEVLRFYWDKYEGNVSKISTKLKISDRTLYRKYKSYGFKNGRQHYQD